MIGFLYVYLHWMCKLFDIYCTLCGPVETYSESFIKWNSSSHKCISHNLQCRNAIEVGREIFHVHCVEWMQLFMLNMTRDIHWCWMHLQRMRDNFETANHCQPLPTVHKSYQIYNNLEKLPHSELDKLVRQTYFVFHLMSRNLAYLNSELLMILVNWIIFLRILEIHENVFNNTLVGENTRQTSRVFFYLHTNNRTNHCSSFMIRNLSHLWLFSSRDMLHSTENMFYYRKSCFSIDHSQKIILYIKGNRTIYNIPEKWQRCRAGEMLRHLCCRTWHDKFLGTASGDTTVIVVYEFDTCTTLTPPPWMCMHSFERASFPIIIYRLIKLVTNRFLCMKTMRSIVVADRKVSR